MCRSGVIHHMCQVFRRVGKSHADVEAFWMLLLLLLRWYVAALGVCGMVRLTVGNAEAGFVQGSVNVCTWQLHTEDDERKNVDHAGRMKDSGCVTL